jgi:hypothetical protein
MRPVCITGHIGQRLPDVPWPGPDASRSPGRGTFHAHRPGTLTLLRLVPRGLREPAAPPDGAPLWTAGSGDVTGESPCPVTAAGQPEAHRGRYQNRAAVFCRGLLVYVLPIAVAGSIGAAVGAGRLGAGACVVRRRRRWHKGRGPRRAPLRSPQSQVPASTGRRGPLTRPQPHGRDRRSAVRLHPSRHGPGDTSRPSPASGASLDGSAREAGGPGPGPGGTRSRVAWGL